MSRSLYAKLHRRFGPKLSGAEISGRSHAKQAEFTRWLGLASLPSDCGQALPNGIAIVGGGFAGLAAAWTLGQAGVASTVFEARKTYGGRVESDRSSLSPCRVIETGAELIGFNHPMWIDLARRFGLGLTVLTGEDQYAAMGLEMPLRIGGKSVPDPEKLYEQMAFVLQKISNDAKAITDPFAPWKAPGAATLDAKSVADKIADFVRLVSKSSRHPMLREALELQLGNDNVLPTKEQSYLGLLALVSGGRLGPEDKKLSGYWEHNEDFRCAEGNDRLATMMLEYGKRIRLLASNPVTRIEISETGPLVKVTWLDSPGRHQSKNFDYVILTAPPSVWKKITITPALPPGREMALGPAVKYISHVDGRFWIKAGMAPSGASDELGQTWEATENQALASRGVALSVFAGGTFVPKSDALKHFRTQLLKLYPGYRMKAEYYADWPNVPWIETGYSCPRVGQVTTIGKFLSIPHKKRLFFAGEHTCMAYFGYMEGALQSGARAAKAILATCSKVSGRSDTRERRVHEYQRAESVAVPSGSWDSRYSNDGSVAGVYGELTPGQVGRAAESGLPGDFEAESEFGGQVLAAAEAAAESDDTAPRSSAALLEILLGSSPVVESEAEGEAIPLSPLGHQGPAPSATTLFNAFVYPNHSLFPRNALHRHYARRFQVLAYPGQAMPDLDPRPGDLLLRVAQGQGWGHVAIVASGDLYRHDRLGDVGLRGEGYPRLRPGLYIQVVEVGPRRRCLADLFARRVSDGAGLVLPDTLLLRPLSPRQSPWEAEAEPGSDTRPGTAGLRMGGPAERPITLRRGDAGPAVREAQRRLNRVHADAVALGLPGLTGCPLVEEGRFGERMEMAVQSFQQQVFGDPAAWNGVISQKTWAQLDLLTGVGTSKNQPAQAAPSWMSGPLSSGTVPESLFGEWNVDAETGDVNRNSLEYIRWVQSSLNQILGTQLVVDGVMGSRTRTSIRNFQQQRGLTADGIVGRRTDEALRAALSGGVSVPPVTPCTTLDHFPQGSDTILPEHQLKLIAIARQILVEHISNVDITGFTSSEGSDAENVALGQRRADRVARELRTTLERMRPGSSRAVTLIITSRGESEQIGAGDLELNRRVTICLQIPRPSPTPTPPVPPPAPVPPVPPPPPIPASRIHATEVSDYVSLDFVLEDLTGTVPSVFSRRAAFRDLSSLTAIVPGALTSALIGGPIRRDPSDASKFQTRIRMQLVFPSNTANPLRPAGSGKLPLAVLVHGNHNAYRVVGGVLSDKESFKGYRYLQDDLARSGIASISVDTNMANQTGSFIELRADIVLEALKLLKQHASAQGDVLFNRINFDRVALMGHSRGGDAVVRVVKKNTTAPTTSRFGIRTVCSLAPTDVTGGQIPADRTFLDQNELNFYSVLYGALDGDVSGLGGSSDPFGTGFRHYDRARCQKALVFAERCCHNSFNSIWHADGIDSGVRAADRVPGRLVDEATHQTLAKEYIGGQFKLHLNGAIANISLFNGTTASATGLKTVILWSFGNPIRHIDDFENPAVTLAGGTRRLNSGAVIADFGSIAIPVGHPINDHVLEQGHVVHADTSRATGSPFGVETTLPAGRSDLSSLTTLALDIGAFFDTTSEASIIAGIPPTFSIILHDRAGAVATVDGVRFRPTIGRPFFHELSTGENVTALRLETMRIPLSAFTGIDLRNVVKIQVEVAPPSGHLFVDHIKLAAF